MNRNARYFVVAAALLSVAGWVWLVAQSRGAQDNPTRDDVLKIAESIKKGNKDEATKQAKAMAKKLEGLEELMELFKKRADGGLGVGPKAGLVAPDGIEIKLVAIGRDAPTPATMKKEAEHLEEMAYAVAALAEVIHAKGPPRGKSKDWGEWATEMRAAAGKLAEAAKSKSGASLKTAAAKLNDTCNACHSKYRK